MSARTVIGLGSNLGSRESFLRAAVDLLAATPGCTIIALSSLYETEPVGSPGPLFLNAAVSLQTELAPGDLLLRLQAIETALGRVRRQRWEARTIDLDILWSEKQSASTPHLTVPHPRLRQRAFALAPLLEVAPGLSDSYGACLRDVGGSPPTCGSLELRPTGLTDAPHYDGRVRLMARDRADALAMLGTCLAAATGSAVSGFPLQVAPIACRCEPDREPDAFARAIVELTGSGFRPCRALVCNLESGMVQGRLVGRPGDPSGGPPRELRVSERKGAIELFVYSGTDRLNVVTFINPIA